MLSVYHFYFLLNSVLAQFNIFQCISKHKIPHAGDSLTFFSDSIFVYFPKIERKIADKAQVLTCFNCLRNRELNFIYDAM